MKQEANLVNIFKLQDLAFCQNQKQSTPIQGAVTSISKAISVNYEILSNMKFGANKQTAIRHFAGDTLSNIVVAVRLGLWGALPESLAVLRGAVESSAQLAFVVAHEKYNSVISEMGGKFKQVSFQASCAGLGEVGKNIRHIHGHISDMAAHSTARRFSLMDYEFNGATYDRLGFTFCVENVEFAILKCLPSCSLVANSLRRAHEQEGLRFEWAQGVSEVEDALASAQASIEPHCRKNLQNAVQQS